MSDVQSYHSGMARDAESGLAATAAQLEAILADLGGYVNYVSSHWDADEQQIYRDQVQAPWDKSASVVLEMLRSVKVALGENTQSVDLMRARVRARLSA